MLSFWLFSPSELASSLGDANESRRFLASDQSHSSDLSLDVSVIQVLAVLSLPQSESATLATRFCGQLTMDFGE